MIFGALTFQEYLEKQKVRPVSLHFPKKKKKNPENQTRNAKYSALYLHNKDSNRYCAQVVVQNLMFKDKRLNDLSF